MPVSMMGVGEMGMRMLHARMPMPVWMWRPGCHVGMRMHMVFVVLMFVLMFHLLVDMLMHMAFG